MTNQALQAMAKAFEGTTFKGDTLIGTIADGGAIWTTAQALFPGCTWNIDASEINFADGSFVTFGRHPDSMFQTTYKAFGVPVMVQETRTNAEIAKDMLDRCQDYAETADGRLLVSFQEFGVWLMAPGCETMTWEARESLVMLPFGANMIYYVSDTHAYKWLASTTQTAYCLDVLSISANDPNASSLVEALEKRFIELLKTWSVD